MAQHWPNFSRPYFGGDRLPDAKAIAKPREIFGLSSKAEAIAHVFAWAASANGELLVRSFRMDGVGRSPNERFTFAYR